MAVPAVLAALFAAGAATAQAPPQVPQGAIQVTLPDGRAMAYHCVGAGRVTVVLDTGLGLPMRSWGPVVNGLRRYARVCAYDRAGYPGSTGGPMPRDAAHAVTDLHDLLREADLPGPYILVGQSVGAFNMRLYADRYPKDVVGLVLVDPAFRDEAKAFAQASPAMARELSQEANLQALCIGALAKGKTWADNDPKYGVCGPAPQTDSTDRARAIMSEESSANRSADQVAQAHSGRPDLPVIVLTPEHARDSVADISREEQAAVLQVAIQAGEAIAGGYARGVQRTVAGSGQVIQTDRPNAVVSAVLEVLGQVR
jgi:pimeloyl-ACP methyl ester carboxylesterase